MGLRDWFSGNPAAATSRVVTNQSAISHLRAAPAAPASGGMTVMPRAEGIVIANSGDLDAYLRGAHMMSDGPRTMNAGMQIPVVNACVRIRAGVVANLPIEIRERVDDKVNRDARDHPVSKVLKRKPNGWQKPSAFRRQLHMHVLLRGNGFAVQVRGFRRKLLGLLPLHPDRVSVSQENDQTIKYEYTRPDGSKQVYRQDEIFHVMGPSLDGVTGVSVLTWARLSLDETSAMGQHGRNVFQNGARAGGFLSHPQKLGKEGGELLRASLDDYRAGGEKEGKVMILEEGMKYEPLGMTSVDAQWIESRRFARSEIAMFFGVPPHMIGDNEKTNGFGTGLEQQNQGFLTYTAEDDLIAWEDAINVDLLGDDADEAFYGRFNRKALVRGDMKTRWETYVKRLQWGVSSPDQILEMEDENPRPDGKGGVFYPPPNMTRDDDAGADETEKGNGNDNP